MIATMLAKIPVPFVGSISGLVTSVMIAGVFANML